MVEFILYITPALLLVIGLIAFFTGRVKKHHKLQGIGVGLIIGLFVLEAPGFIEGFIEGFNQQYNG